VWRNFDFSPPHLLVNDLLMIIPWIYSHLQQRLKKIAILTALAKNINESKNAQVSPLCACVVIIGRKKEKDEIIYCWNVIRYSITRKETIYPQELNWTILASHFQPLHVEKQTLNIYNPKHLKESTFKQLAHLHRDHFLHGLSRIEVPSAPFGAQDLEGSAPKAYTLKNKRQRM
jgi:hypothetical protein